MPHLLARIELPIHESLDAFALRLTHLMPGFTFEDDMTGRYEEVPTLVAQHEGMEFTLFGVPLGEVGDEYELTFRCRTDQPIAKLLEQDAGGFVSQFVRDKALNERGFMDFSEELAQLLIQLGISGCKPILPVTGEH